MKPVIALSSDSYFEDTFESIDTFHSVLDELYCLSEHEPLSIGQELSANWLSWASSVKSLLQLDAFEIHFSEADCGTSEIDSTIQYEWSANTVKAEILRGSCWLQFLSKYNITESQKKTISDISEHFKQAFSIQRYFKNTINHLHDLYALFEKLPVSSALLDQEFKCQLINQQLIGLCNKDVNLKYYDNYIHYFQEGKDLLARTHEQLQSNQVVLIELPDYIYVVKAIESQGHDLAEKGFKYVLFIFPTTLHKDPQKLIESEASIEDELVTLGLSKKEATLALYIGLGGSTQEYADAVSRSLKTIQTQLKSIFRKCQLHSQKDLVLFIYSKRVDRFLSQLSHLDIGEV